jgi:hypothetical protein
MDLKVNVPERYRVSYDSKTGSFWILDCWHESVRNIPDLKEAKIPDDSPALVVINQGQANAFIGELKRLGWLGEGTNSKTDVTESKEPVSIQEIAINKIAEIVKVTELDEAVAKEAISALRELGAKIR